MAAKKKARSRPTRSARPVRSKKTAPKPSKTTEQKPSRKTHARLVPRRRHASQFRPLKTLLPGIAKKFAVTPALLYAKVQAVAKQRNFNWMFKRVAMEDRIRDVFEARMHGERLPADVIVLASDPQSRAEQYLLSFHTASYKDGAGAMQHSVRVIYVKLRSPIPGL